MRIAYTYADRRGSRSTGSRCACEGYKELLNLKTITSRRDPLHKISDAR
jgi:hypothetical protein